MIQTRFKRYYNNAIDLRISLDGYSSKIRKVSRGRPTVSNETILATKQEFFITKVASIQSITDNALLVFWLILIPSVFISSYTTIYFFVNNFVFECLYFSECDIWMFLFVFWLRYRPSIKYVRNWGNGCVLREGRGRNIGHKIRKY